MKKISFGVVAGLATLAMLMVGCKNDFSETNIPETKNSNSSSISLKITELKENGLLDELILSVSRNAISEDDAEVLRFINNTDEVLEEIKNTENGDDEIAVIQALFTESSVEDFANAFAKIDSEKADDFLSYVNENLQIETANENARSVASTKNLNILFNTSTNSSSQRAIYASDLEWSTIYWYTGFCAATIAGFYLASYGGFWTRIAGWVAASAGTASMVVQLKKWYDCTELGSFISSLVGKNSAVATKILNKTEGVKLATIVAETTATIIACYVTPAGCNLVEFVVHYMNLIIKKVLSVLPSGINYIINGIPIKIITL